MMKTIYTPEEYFSESYKGSRVVIGKRYEPPEELKKTNSSIFFMDIDKFGLKQNKIVPFFH